MCSTCLSTWTRKTLLEPPPVASSCSFESDRLWCVSVQAGMWWRKKKAVQTLVRTGDINLSQAPMILIVPVVILRQKEHMLNKLVLEWIWRGVSVTSLCLYSVCLWRSSFYLNSFICLTDDIPHSLSDKKTDIRIWTCLTSSWWIGHNYYLYPLCFGFMPSS